MHANEVWSPAAAKTVTTKAQREEHKRHQTESNILWLLGSVFCGSLWLIMAAQAFHSDNSTEDFDAHNLETGWSCVIRQRTPHGV
jgi:hypothetical protein